MSIWLTLTGRDTHKHVLSFLWSSNVMWSFRGASGQGEASQKADIIISSVCLCVWLVVILHNESEWPSVTQRGNLVLLWQQQVNGAWARWCYHDVVTWLDEGVTQPADPGSVLSLPVCSEIKTCLRRVTHGHRRKGREVYAACAWCESRIWAFGRRMQLIKSLQKSSENSTLDAFNPWKQLFSDNSPLNRLCLIFGNITFREKTRAARSWATVNSLVTLSKSL